LLAGTGEQKKTKEPKGRAVKRTTNENTILFDDSNVERGMEEHIRLEEEEEEEGSEEAAPAHEQENLGVDEEAISEGKSSVAVIRLGA
jgi:hypothetical protein